MPAQPVFLHVGLMKTGTSYLQRVLRDSTDALAAQGLSVVPRNQVRSRRLALAVRGLGRPESQGGHAVLGRLSKVLDEAPGDRRLITEETLAFAAPRHVARLGEALAGHPVHLVATVRDLARAVPSAWQQRVRNHHALGFEEFVESIVGGEGSAAEAFWQGQGLLGVLRRWGALAPPERTHVVIVPPSGSDPELLLRRFCSVLDVDPESLNRAQPAANESLGVAQTELLRRVNEQLPAGLSVAEHGETYKRLLALEVLAAQPGRRLRLHAAHRDWCREQAARTVEGIRTRGYQVSGDLAELTPDDAAFVDEPIRVPESEVLESAVAALVALLERGQGRA